MILIAQEGFVWLDVTTRARQIWKTQAFELFHVWRMDEKTLRMPIHEEAELEYALQTSFPVIEQHRICIEIGDSVGKKLDFVTLESWDNADKIQHNGFIYVRYADLNFCK